MNPKQLTPFLPALHAKRVQIIPPPGENRLFLLTVLISTLFVFAAIVGVSLPASGENKISLLLSRSPINPGFLNYVKSMQSTAALMGWSLMNRKLGLIPSPLDLSHLKAQPETSYSPNVLGFPARFDLRTRGKLTPVRDQGDCGSCWAFATFGSLESVLLPDEIHDFSENHLKNTHGFDLGHCDGGNISMATAYLSRWSGPVSEEDDPYNPYSDVSPPGLDAVKHVQEVLFLPPRSTSTDNGRIKRALMQYGAVYTSMYIDTGHYNSSNSAYFYDGTSPPNHAVVIVGWDDNYSRYNFLTQPPGNGAFIVRNSWGSSWGEDGYFYVSYYDKRFARGKYAEVAVLNLAQETTNYSSVYQYDPTGWTASVGFSSEKAWFANVFEANGNEFLKAVGFYTTSKDAIYKIEIYTDVGSSPKDGTLSAIKTGTISFSGYHTVPLDAPVFLASGTKFSVVVKVKTPGYNYPIPVEYPFEFYNSSASASYGQSYVSPDGIVWFDIGVAENTNVCVKAYTYSGSEVISTPSAIIGPISASLGVTYTFAVHGSSSNYGHDVEYLFDWGDGTDSGWLGAGITRTSKSWASAGTYTVRVKARCTADTSVESEWLETSITVSETSYSEIVLISPVPGESIPSGSIYSIQWGAPPQATRFKVYLSKDNGVTWTLVKGPDGEEFVTSWNLIWYVPVPRQNKRQSLIKVIAYDSSGNKIKVGKLESPFTIEVVRLTYPDGGENFTAGDEIPIQWLTNQTKVSVWKVALYYSTDNGLTWTLIDSIRPNLGWYPWKIPGSPSPQSRVKVVLLDSYGNTLGADKSDETFVIAE